MKKTEELKNLNAKDMKKKLDEISLELMKLKGQVSTGSNPKNPSQIKILKKTIARLKTLNK